MPPLLVRPPLSEGDKLLRAVGSLTESIGSRAVGDTPFLLTLAESKTQGRGS